MKTVYFWWALSWFFVLNKRLLHPPGCIEARMKLPTGPVITSSLCGNPCHNTVSTKIHLGPLIYIICACWPSSSYASTSLEVQPSLDYSNDPTIFRRGSDLSVPYLSVLHTHCFGTCFIQEKEKYFRAGWHNQYDSFTSKTYLKNWPIDWPINISVPLIKFLETVISKQMRLLINCHMTKSK